MSNNKYTIENPMPPRWLMYPDISQYSIGWRMGYGEDYRYKLGDWLETLSKDERKKYDEMFPKPIFWRDSFEEDYYFNGIDFWQKGGKAKFSKDKLNTSKKLKFLFFWKTAKQDLDKGYLSQWQFSKFEVDIDKFFYAEQYMMFWKASLFKDEEIKKQILNSKDVKQIKALGRKVKNFNQEIWDKVKYSIVLNANYYKFSQNKQMRDYLLSTGNKILVEASPVDKIWGVGLAEDDERINNIYHWKGQNLLGFALMEVREEIKRIYKNYDKIDWKGFIEDGK